MHTKNVRLPICAAFVLSWIHATQLTASADQYEIRLDRPERVGNKYAVSLRAETRGVIRPVAGERPLPESLKSLEKTPWQTGLELELDASVEVLKVDGAGRVLKQALTVERWLLDDQDNGEGFDPQSKVIVAETIDGETRFTLDGRPVGEYYSEILRIVVATHTGGRTLDATYGTTKRRKIGESWTMKADADFIERLVGKDRLPSGISLSDVGPSATVKLTKMERNGAAGFQVDSSFHRTGIFAGGPPVEEGASIERSELKHSFSGRYPLDPAARCLRQVESRRWEIVTKFPGQDYLMLQGVEQVVTRKFAPSS
ncbi:MAG: hypothetical protein WD069_03120 [Planctomycetales bacterium]